MSEKNKDAEGNGHFEENTILNSQEGQGAKSIENASQGDNEEKNEKLNFKSNNSQDPFQESENLGENFAWDSNSTQDEIIRKRKESFDAPDYISDKPEKSWFIRNLKILVPFMLVVVAAIVYVGGFFYYSGSFLPNTIINGKNYGGKSVSQVENQLKSPIQNDIILVGRDGKEEVFPLANIGYAEEVESGEIKKIYDAQSSATWILKLFSEEQYQVDSRITYDKDALYNSVHGLEIVSGKNVQEPEDARIERVDGTYVIVPEILGNSVDAPELKKAIISAGSQRESKIDLEEKKCYKNPVIKADSPEIEKALSEIEPLEDLIITFDFEVAEEILDYDTFSPWIKLGSSGLDFNRDGIDKYVGGLSAKYDTLNTNRDFKSSNRGVITVGGGIYGWQIDSKKMSDQIVDLLKKGNSVKVEPVYFSYARTRGFNDIGSTYFELDLTNQHMWLYINGELLAETPVVTGLPGGKRTTPAGVFVVWSKETARFLEGTDYKLWVDYWMPIDWTGVGIHDAPWQEVFGGDRYLVYGSHGCVNTPPSLFPLIFDNVPIGTPVVVYY